MSRGRTPAPPPPPIIVPPEEEKKLELNPEAKNSNKKRTQKTGTRSLQIPMGGTGGGTSGLSIPKA